MIDRALTVAGIAATIIFGVLLVAYPKLNRKLGFVGLAVGGVLLVAAGVIAVMPDDGNAQAPPVANQQGGNAANYPPPVPRLENAPAPTVQPTQNDQCQSTGIINRGNGNDWTVGSITGFNCGVRDYGSGGVWDIGRISPK